MSTDRFELTLSGDKGELVRIDLHPETGQAAANGGNVYLEFNGVLIGTLWLDGDAGSLVLGRYTEELGSWDEFSRLPLDGAE